MNLANLRLVVCLLQLTEAAVQPKIKNKKKDIKMMLMPMLDQQRKPYRMKSFYNTANIITKVPSTLK